MIISLDPSLDQRNYEKKHSTPKFNMHDITFFLVTVGEKLKIVFCYWNGIQTATLPVNINVKIMKFASLYHAMAAFYFSNEKLRLF